MTIRAIARRPAVPAAPTPRKAAASAPRAAADPAPVPVSLSLSDLNGLQPDAYAVLARSFKQKGNQNLADQFTWLAVTNAKTPSEALGYATQRYGPNANPQNPAWDEYVRIDAPYTASPKIQLQAETLAASKFKTFDEAVTALRSSPAETPEANSVLIRRVVDLAEDNERVQYIMPLIKDLGTPDAIAYAEAATKTKPQISWWTRLCRGLEESQL